MSPLRLCTSIFTAAILYGPFSTSIWTAVLAADRNAISTIPSAVAHVTTLPPNGFVADALAPATGRQTSESVGQAPLPTNGDSSSCSGERNSTSSVQNTGLALGADVVGTAVTGDALGLLVGLRVGGELGELVGLEIGEDVGGLVGLGVGGLVGLGVGGLVGLGVGGLVGLGVGGLEGLGVGGLVGLGVGGLVGLGVGGKEGLAVSGNDSTGGLVSCKSLSSSSLLISTVLRFVSIGPVLFSLYASGDIMLVVVVVESVASPTVSLTDT
jgi:hypothetical protein